VLQGLAAVESQLSTVRGDSAAPLREILEQAQVSVNEMVGVCQNLLDGCQNAPWRIAELDERLDDYSRLLERYHGSIDELVNRREELERRLVELAGIEEELEEKRTGLSETLEELSAAARSLSKARFAGAGRLQDSVTEELKRLGMPEAVFSVELTPPPSSSSLVFAEQDGSGIASFGLEQVEFLFSANPGSPAGPLSSIASGGELSRASLAMKLALAEVAQPGTMVFDEIDSGVAGETAHLLADALERAASGGRQVIVITHLAQIACRADRHISVSKRIEKDLPVTMVRSLEREDRVAELARVLGGGEAALAHARSLLDRKSH
jgi:DNA repair protein RecN (Recombination protein N)